MRIPALPIVSFPKSGRTWLRYAAALAEIEPSFTHAGHPTSLEELGFPFRGIPEGLAARPVIFLHRNPIDTAVSYYFQVLHKDCRPERKTWRKMATYGRLPPKEIDEFVLHKTFGIDLILDFNRAWLNHLETSEGSVVFTYEQFMKDPVAQFTRFFAALGHPDVDARLIAQYSTFKKMKHLQATRQGDPWRLVQTWGHDPESGKVRKGKVKGYMDYLKTNTISACRVKAVKAGFEGE